MSHVAGSVRPGCAARAQLSELYAASSPCIQTPQPNRAQREGVIVGDSLRARSFSIVLLLNGFACFTTRRSSRLSFGPSDHSCISNLPLGDRTNVYLPFRLIRG